MASNYEQARAERQRCEDWYAELKHKTPYASSSLYWAREALKKAEQVEDEAKAAISETDE